MPLSPSPSAQAVSLADFTESALIVPELRQRDTAGVIQELSRVLQQQARVPDLLPFYHAALNREYLISTAMEFGMAFPHARMAEVERLCFALGRSPEPIHWGGKTTCPVRLVFLMAVPATESTGYLYALSGLARLGRENPLLLQLQNARTAGEMLDALRQVPLRNGKSG
jgi:mannitol/fructose-specific phosphotransferase system IIA component (Ntr-type)